MVRSIAPKSLPGWAILLVAAGIGAGTAAFAPLAPDQGLLLGITFFCIVLWITTPVPPWFTGLAGIALIGVALSPELAMDGFAEPVLWLIVFGLIMGEAIHRSGLARSVEFRLIRWITPGDQPHPPPDQVDPIRLYRRLLIVLSVGGLVFALMVPSSLVRVLIMAPMLIEIGKIFDSDRARLGLLFGPLFATFYGGVGVLTAFLPNIITTGILESLTGVSISWTAWFVTIFPVMGLGRVLLIIAVVYLLYRPPSGTGLSFSTRSRPATDDVRRTALILLVGVAFWSTDFIHGLHPVFGALVVAMLLLTPGVGTVTFDTIEDVDFSIVFFVGAVFAIAAGLAETEVTDLAATYLLSLIPEGVSPVLLLVAVFVVTLALMLIIEGLAAASVLTPVLISFAERVGLPVEVVVQVEAIALGHFFFPYQSIVLVAMLSYGPITMRNLMRITAILSIVSMLLLVPIQLLLLMAF